MRQYYSTIFSLHNDVRKDKSLAIVYKISSANFDMTACFSCNSDEI